MPRLFLRDAKPGDVFDDVYMLTNKQLGAAKNGEPYLKGFVGDRTATLTARWWKIKPTTFEKLPDAGFVRLAGRVENYQNNLQVVIEQAWQPQPGTFDEADLVAHTTRDIPQMFDRLVAVLRTIRNGHLLALVEAYLADEPLMDDLRHAPAAQSFHHAFLGGLLEHTLNAVEVASAVCPFYPGLNRDLVVAGIFLHDIAKTWELTYATAFAYSDGGQLIGHIVKAAMWVEDKRRAAEAQLGEPIPQQLVDVVQHIILSHHGQLDFGSPKVPMTPEALAVHTLENLDAKLMMALSACRGDHGTGSWTEFQKALGTKMYRPDVAPPDLPATPAVASPVTSPVTSAATPAGPTAAAALAAAVGPAAAEPVEKPPLMITNPLFESMDLKRR